MSSLILDMLGDGGSYDRHYRPEKKTVEEILALFQKNIIKEISPESYTKVLKFYWNDLMSGKLSFQNFNNKFECKSLFETAADRIKNNEIGLINVN
jgi:hypothetical protein